jgi:hypothetical protein
MRRKLPRRRGASRHFPLPDMPDIDHDDLVVECTFTLGEYAFKQRALNCIAYEGFVELTIEPHPG